MKSILKIVRYCTFIGASAYLLMGTSFAATDDAPLVKVETYAQHVGSNIVNNYILTNNSDREIVNFFVGYFLRDIEMGTGRTELKTYPTGTDWVDEEILSNGVSSGPTNWEAELYQQEGNIRIAYTWSAEDRSGFIAKGQSRQFSISTPLRDLSYLTSHFRVDYTSVSGQPESYSATMVLIDRTPPTLSLTASPSTIWPPNNKRVPVSITVNVTDDYDGAPEIVLESIISNETLATNDIVGADLGKDDRNFDLMATRAGGNTTGRIYTITYAAIDASGNKSTASVNVTVPHDQGKK